MGSGGRARLTLSYVVLLAAFGVGLRVVQLQLSLRAAQADLETTEHRCKRIATHSRFVDGDQIKDTLGDISATQQILEADEQRAHGVQFRSNVMGQVLDAAGSTACQTQLEAAEAELNHKAAQAERLRQVLADRAMEQEMESTMRKLGMAVEDAQSLPEHRQLMAEQLALLSGQPLAAILALGDAEMLAMAEKQVQVAVEDDDPDADAENVYIDPDELN